MLGEISKLEAKLGSILVGDLHKVIVMGVVNLSPESFYKGSIPDKTTTIEKHVIKHVEEGAKIIDFGGQSTRPPSIYGGEKPVTIEEELIRVKQGMDAIKELSDSYNFEISLDTIHSEIAQYGLENGATIINDISGLKEDANMARIIADHSASAIFMSCFKTPGDAASSPDIAKSLLKSVQIASKAGISKKKIVLDPGIGGWGGRSHNFDLSIIRNLNQFRILGQPLLVAISRKSTIGTVLNKPDPLDRLEGTLSATAIAVFNGCHVVRTHDVAKSIDTIRMAEAIRLPIKRGTSTRYIVEDLSFIQKTWSEEILRTSLGRKISQLDYFRRQSLLLHNILASEKDLIFDSFEIEGCTVYSSHSESLNLINIILIGTAEQIKKGCLNLQGSGPSLCELADLLEAFLN